MGNASTKAKRKYNSKKYGSIHVYLDKETVTEFRKLANEVELSQAEIIRYFISTFNNHPTQFKAHIVRSRL